MDYDMTKLVNAATHLSSLEAEIIEIKRAGDDVHEDLNSELNFAMNDVLQHIADAMNEGVTLRDVAKSVQHLIEVPVDDIFPDDSEEHF